MIVYFLIGEDLGRCDVGELPRYPKPDSKPETLKRVFDGILEHVRAMKPETFKFTQTNTISLLDNNGMGFVARAEIIQRYPFEDDWSWIVREITIETVVYRA